MGIYDNALSGKVNYKAFFEWFRNQKDGNNEQIVSQQILEEPAIPYAYQAVSVPSKPVSNKPLPPQTWAIHAIESILVGYTNFRLWSSSRLLLDKDSRTIQFEQLSDGEKNLIALIGDIARRLTIANPKSDNPLLGEGIILIDEIELHLHPSWQRLIVPKLTQTFPNCQFFITTHSPQVISHVKPESVFILKSKDGKIGHETVPESYGMNSDLILESIMEVDSRPTEIKEAFSFIYNLISDGKIDEAREKIDLLSQAIGDDPELHYAKALIIRKQAIVK
jgi:predicted ATP-binding protein involved in virulence